MHEWGRGRERASSVSLDHSKKPSYVLNHLPHRGNIWIRILFESFGWRRESRHARKSQPIANSSKFSSEAKKQDSKATVIFCFRRPLGASIEFLKFFKPKNRRQPIQTTSLKNERILYYCGSASSSSRKSQGAETNLLRQGGVPILFSV